MSTIQDLEARLDRIETTIIELAKTAGYQGFPNTRDYVIRHLTTIPITPLTETKEVK